MFTYPLIEIKLRSLITVLCSGYQSCHGDLCKAVPGKLHGSGGHSKCNCLHDRINFHRSQAWHIVLICVAGSLRNGCGCIHWSDNTQLGGSQFIFKPSGTALSYLLKATSITSWDQSATRSAKPDLINILGHWCHCILFGAAWRAQCRFKQCANWVKQDLWRH